MSLAKWTNRIVTLAFLLVVTSSSVTAQNPVPLINQPLVPTAALPGGASFTLVVNGTGFVSASVVEWNGNPRVTTFVNSSQLKAAITASDIAAAGTALVTVSNPGPGGGISNVGFVQITNPTNTVALTSSNSPSGGAVFESIVGADFNADGKFDLAVAHASSTISVMLGNGDGTFQAPVNYSTGTDATHLAAGDFNGDGKIDLAVTNGGDNTVSILLGNGDGTFQAATTYSTGKFPIPVTTGDFNRDGKLDLAVHNKNDSTVSIFLGNGDGTFQVPINSATGGDGDSMFAGDFNGDGKLDLVITNLSSNNSVIVLLGNGDGTFQAPVNYSVGSFPQWVCAADLNGDGKLDLVVANELSSTVSVLLGNGDGTFKTHVDYNTSGGPTAVAIGDFNGDGKLDLATANCFPAGSCAGSGSVSILFGNGDGTFQSHLDTNTGASLAVTAGDFNRDGRLDLVIGDGVTTNVSVLLQTPMAAPNVLLSTTSINFNGQLVNTSSAPPQNVTLKNTGGAALTISSTTITGADTSDFSETDTCGTGVAAGASCTISVTFKPSATGTRSASVTVTDNASGSPHSVSLTGTGTDFSLAANTGANCPTGGNCSTSATITAGQTATYNLQVSPDSGFNGNVALSCSGAPSPSTCSVSPTSVPPNGTSNYSFAVTVSNTSGVAVAPFRLPHRTIRPRALPLGLFILALVSALMLLTRLASPAGRPNYVLVAACGLLLLCLTYTGGCSGVNTVHNQKQPVNATLTVTGTSSSVTHTVSLSLTVNP